MADAIQTLIADLQREKRAADPRAEPIIVPNLDMQNAFAEIETAIGGLVSAPAYSILNNPTASPATAIFTINPTIGGTTTTNFLDCLATAQFGGEVTITNPQAPGIAILSGNANWWTGIAMGRTTPFDVKMVVSAAANQNTTYCNEQPGDTVIQPASGQKLIISDLTATGGTGGITFQVHNSSSTYLLVNNDTGGNCLEVTGGGAVLCPSLFSGSGTAIQILSNQLVIATSSIRYKTRIRPFNADTGKTGAIIDALKPVRYSSLAEADDPETNHYGFIAEDVAQVVPELVQWIPADEARKTRAMRAAPNDKDLPPPRIPDGYKSLDAYISANQNEAGEVPESVQYDRLISLLVAEIQELRARVQRLERSRK